MLGDMMFGTMPIKSQTDGLKMYYITKHEVTKAVFIKLFCVEVEIDAGQGKTVRIPCKTQFAFGVVFSVMPESEHALAERVGILPECPEIKLLFAHFSFVEVQLDNLLKACRATIAHAIANQCGHMEQVVRAKLPKGCLQGNLCVSRAAKLFMENVLVFMKPQKALPPFFGVSSSGALLVNNKLAKSGGFFAALCEILEAYNAPHTNFFVSSVVTALLTHHLTWLMATLPEDATKQMLDANGVCSAMVNSLYGMSSPAGKYCKVIILGPDTLQIDRLVEILTYFIRCGSVIERVDVLDEPDFLTQREVHLPTNDNPDVGEPSNGNSGNTFSSPSARFTCPSAPTLEGSHLSECFTNTENGYDVPLPKFHTQTETVAQSHHCYSAYTSCLTVPFVIMKLPVSHQQSWHAQSRTSSCSSFDQQSSFNSIPKQEVYEGSHIELTDDDLNKLCKDPVMSRSSEGFEGASNSNGETGADPALSLCNCVVVNAFSKLCYVAHVEHEPGLEVEGQRNFGQSKCTRVNRRVIPPSDFIHQMLHQLKVWKRLGMQDPDLFGYLDAQLYAIYQQSLVLGAIVGSGCPEKLSYQLIASILGVSTSHIPLVMAVALCYDPSLRSKLPEPPLVSYTPSFKLEQLMENLF